MQATGIQLYPPDSTDVPSLSGEVFPYDAFMGKWHVVWSTLPLWNDKKDVTITYKSLPSDGEKRKFDDLVEYRKQSASSDSAPSTVLGVDTLNTSSTSHGAAFDWRGKGWLMIATSHWQVLGYDPAPEPQWAVTYFSKTLFTPAGVDIYLRSPITPDNRVLVQEIVSKLKHVPGEIARLSGSGFVVGEAK
ncbi:hypothetical protein HD553DRAFT_305260 [Filobasidium floriforme]|uniref:uncharacterized protein n=1 Tax=Filobasidium floriforme TaxID=5210 RepID=UPI001E8ED5C9|nr:uncharacterized protein HD553DRAFT_305260 [Filobasidium floriforme]KAH8089148.1 hypothetical protein HD553DRAFT_305260 [Filobasidium floriforme]